MHLKKRGEFEVFRLHGSGFSMSRGSAKILFLSKEHPLHMTRSLQEEER
jgi:hypothetical protein